MKRVTWNEMSDAMETLVAWSKQPGAFISHRQWVQLIRLPNMLSLTCMYDSTSEPIGLLINALTAAARSSKRGEATVKMEWPYATVAETRAALCQMARYGVAGLSEGDVACDLVDGELTITVFRHKGQDEVEK